MLAKDFIRRFDAYDKKDRADAVKSNLFREIKRIETESKREALAFLKKYVGLNEIPNFDLEKNQEVLNESYASRLICKMVNKGGSYDAPRNYLFIKPVGKGFNMLFWECGYNGYYDAEYHLKNYFIA